MTLQDLVHVLALFTGGFAVYQYRRSVQQRMAETLLKLEEAFSTFQALMLPQIDPGSPKYMSQLASALDKSLGFRKETRTPDEDALIVKLDELLRFMLMLSSVERHRLVDKDAISYVYHYWFACIRRDPRLRIYVERH